MSKKVEVKEDVIGFDNRKPGVITAMILKKKKIKSPSTAGRVRIGKGIEVVPKVKFKNKIEKRLWIHEQRKKFNIIN